MFSGGRELRGENSDNKSGAENKTWTKKRQRNIRIRIIRTRVLKITEFYFDVYFVFYVFLNDNPIFFLSSVFFSIIYLFI